MCPANNQEEYKKGLTQLPLWGAHGLHHPDGQSGLQDSDSHVGKAERAWGERKQTGSAALLDHPSVSPSLFAKEQSK